MEAYFLDILAEWPKLAPFLSHPKFIQALNIYHWWNSEPEIGNDQPLLKRLLSSDELYVAQKLKECDQNSPYWYCVPHECVELNIIVMGTLISLYTRQELFYLRVDPLPCDPTNYHIIVCNKPLKSGDIIELGGMSTQQDDRLMLYDFIYPLMPFFGNSWANRNEKLEKLVVTNCTPLSQHWKEMNYVSYYQYH